MLQEDKPHYPEYDDVQIDYNYRTLAKAVMFLAAICLLLCLVGIIMDKSPLMLSAGYTFVAGLITIGGPYYYSKLLDKKLPTVNESQPPPSNQWKATFYRNYYKIQGAFMMLFNGFIITVTVQSSPITFNYVLIPFISLAIAYSIRCWHRAFTPKIALIINSDGIDYKAKLFPWENIRSFTLKNLYSIDSEESPQLVLNFGDLRAPYEIPLCDLKLDFDELRQQIILFNTNPYLKDYGDQ